MAQRAPAREGREACSTRQGWEDCPVRGSEKSCSAGLCRCQFLPSLLHMETFTRNERGFLSSCFHVGVLPERRRLTYFP